MAETARSPIKDQAYVQAIIAWRVWASPFSLALILSVPYLIGIATTHGLQSAFPTFHGMDEAVYHYPIIKRFSESFPQMRIWDYDSATTPLFHMIFAAVDRLLDASLPMLRLLNVVAAYISTLVAFQLFRHLRHSDLVTAFLAAMCIGLSPYQFGTSFILLTDSLASLFALASLYLFLRSDSGQHLELFVLATLLASLAVLTRQLNLWVPIFMLVASLSTRGLSAQRVLTAVALFILALMPFGLLFVAWGGLNPPAYQAHLSSLNMRSLSLFLACIGFYGAPFLFVHLVSKGREFAWKETGWLAVIILIATATLLLLAPLEKIELPPDCPHASCGFPTDGFLWRVSDRFPVLFGTSAFLWTLVGAGLGVVVLHAKTYGIRSTAALIAICYGLLSLGNASLYQKYPDTVALLIVLLMQFEWGPRNTFIRRIILGGLCGAFFLYAFANPFVAQESNKTVSIVVGPA